MKTNRTFATALALFVTFFFFKPFSELFFDTILIAVLAAIGVAMLVWRSFETSIESGTSVPVDDPHAACRVDAPRTRNDNIAASILTGAFVGAGAGLIIGTVGPIMMGAGGQAVLAGIFFTGQAGAILGAVVGWIVHRLRRQGQRPEPRR
jgi:hypothetical protein